jgi:CDP-diacylglycerol--glycerol-3-phosphate 3-phosphatidyltransferase
MDRIADAAVFGASRSTWPTRATRTGHGRRADLPAAGQVVSYVKARAQSLDLDADVGIAERLERLIIVGHRRAAGQRRAGLGPARGAVVPGRAVRGDGVPAADPRVPSANGWPAP